GCLEVLPHCMPIFAPNHNALRRLSGTVNVATRASWGYEDRDACLRVPESDARNLRIEHRLAGADANPYLVLAAILVGLEQGLLAGREPIASLNEDRDSGIDFPLEMLEAVQSMQGHTPLREGLGAEFVEVYCENKRQDHLAFMQDISAREYRWFL
ncbi:MAG TPA: glutamine synthetase, partial [Pseudomonas sp.]|nr:glutamine synthetase [Pseudomonas sp.]